MFYEVSPPIAEFQFISSIAWIQNKLSPPETLVTGTSMYPYRFKGKASTILVISQQTSWIKIHRSNAIKYDTPQWFSNKVI